MERSKELSFSVRNSGEVNQQGLVGSTPGFVGDLQLLAEEELEARLQIHERIGGGSSARVYRGTLDGATPVAVKVLHPQAAQRESTLREFLREAQVLARLQNKHIVRLHALAHLPPNFGGLPTRRFTWGIVTEYMEAGTLTKLIQDAARVYKKQQRVKQQLAAGPPMGAGSATGPDRSGSLRQLKKSLSFLRRRSLNAGTAASTGGGAAGDSGPGAGGGGGGMGGTVVPQSPRVRGGPTPVSPAGVGVGAAGGASAPVVLASRRISLTLEPMLPYTDREALQWCMEVALALQFLHAQAPPIVHRDIKTDNVLMGIVATPAAMQSAQPAMQRIATELGMAVRVGSSFTAAHGGMLSSQGSLVRRVLSMRAAAAMAGEEAVGSRAGSVTGTTRPGGGRPLLAKVCDFGLHVVLDTSRPVVTRRRRSFEQSYAGDGLMTGGGPGGGLLPYSSSLTRPSARNSPAGGSAAGCVPSLQPPAGASGGGGGVYGTTGPTSPYGAGAGGSYLAGGASGVVSGRYEARYRRSSMVSNRAHEDPTVYRRAVSRDGDSFSRSQPNPYHCKISYLSPHDPSDQSGLQLAAAASAAAGAAVQAGSPVLSCSPPKPFAGAAVAAAAAAYGISPAATGSTARQSSSAVPAPAVMGLRASGGGAGPGFRSPKTSGPGSGPGPPKWSGSSARVLQHHGGGSGFAATRASLDLLLQGRMSATAGMSVASQSAASSHTSGHGAATGSGAGTGAVGGSNPGSTPGVGPGSNAGGSTAALHGSISNTLGGPGTSYPMDSLSAGQMMFQLQAASTTGMSDRASRLRPSHAGPSTGDLTLGLPPNLTLEAALRMSNRSSSGRPSIATVTAALAAAGGMAGGSGAVSGGGGGPVSGSGMDPHVGLVSTGGGTRGPRPSAGSPATSSRGGTRLRSNPAQVAQYLAMMEEDLQLDVASRSSSKAQAEMDPLYGAGSRPGSQSTATHPRSGAGSGMLGAASNRSLLTAGHSLNQMQQAGQVQALQGSSSNRLSPGSRSRNAPPQPSGRPSPTPSAAAALVAAAAATAAAVAAGRARPSMSGSAGGSGTATPNTTGHGVVLARAVADVAGIGGGGTRAQSCGPTNADSHGIAPSAGSTRSEQGMYILADTSCTNSVNPSGSGVAAQATAGAGTSSTPGGGSRGGGSSPGARAGGPEGQNINGVGGGGRRGGGGRGGTVAAAISHIPRTLMQGLPMLRGPNPMKSSSQPTMSVGNFSLHPSSQPFPGRGPTPMKSSSQPVMSVAAQALVMSGSGGGSGGENKSGSGSGQGGSGSWQGGSGSGAALPRRPLPAAPVATVMAHIAGIPAMLRPMKSSSQPTLTVSAGQVIAAASAAVDSKAGGSAIYNAGGPNSAGSHTSTSSRGPNPMKSSSQPAIFVPGTVVGRGSRNSSTGRGSTRDGGGPFTLLTRTTSNGSRMMSHLSVAGTLTSPTGSVHAMDLSPPAVRVRSASRMGAVAPTGGSIPEADVELPERRSSVAAPPGGHHVQYGGIHNRRNRQHLEVTVPMDTATMDTIGATQPQSRGQAAGVGRPWIATVTAAASPRAHSPVAAAASSAGTDSGSLTPGVAAGSSHSAMPLLLNRELHKVVKRLRPDGGSFTGSGTSPLGLPPTVPGAHAGDGSFTCSRRSSMDSHAPSYASIAFGRSPTAALQPAGSGSTMAGVHSPGGGMMSSIHRDKSLWGRSVLVAGGSAGPSSAAGASAGALLQSSGPAASGAFASDPNSPVSSCGPAPVTSGSLAGRAVTKYSAAGPMATIGGAIGPAIPRTTSGGVSAGGSGRQSSAGERSARQSSLVRNSSSTTSNTAAFWGDYGTGGAGAAAGAAAGAGIGSPAGVVPPGPLSNATSGVVSPSRPNTGGGMRLLLQVPIAGGASGSGLTPSALTSPLLAHVRGAGSQTSSTVPAVASRIVSESAVSASTIGSWTGRDEPVQGEAAYALTGRAGTLLYMAPEVIRHEPYNEKVDVFSFGVVLYEVFGRVLLLELYSKDELEALSSRIAQGFRHHRPDCMPQAIWDLVQQCWAQNPADRPSMPLVVRQIELALEAMDEAEAAAAASASSSHRPGSLFADAGGGIGATSSVMVPASPTVMTSGTGPGSAATGAKERSSTRSMASHKSLISLGSLGRRSRGISFRRRGTSLPRAPQGPTAPIPGRQPPPPANQPSALPDVGGASTGGGSALPSPTVRSALEVGPFEGEGEPRRCLPCITCVIC